IVDDIAETRENLKRVLQFEPGIEVVGAASGGREGIQMVTELQPDVVIMDINMPDMDGITATEEIRRRLPFTQIVILSVQGDPSYMRRAMLAGARDFLTKPPVIDEFIGAVRRAGKLAQEEREKQMALPSTGGLSPETLTSGSVPRGKVITVYAPKGGIGCTTVAVSLAAALSADDTPTVVMDAKLQFGDVALFLNQHGKHSILDLAPRADALDQEIVNQVLLKHESTGLRILAAPVRPEDAEQLNAEQLVHIIDFLRYSHDYIVVDTASALDEFTLAALEHSDVIVLLVAQDLMSIKDAALFLELLHKMEWPLERVMLAMTRYDKRINVSPERVADHLKMSVTAVIPEDLKAAWRAIQRGLPLVKVGGKAALGVMELARAVRRQLAQTVEAG
ncbi:MAG TPA: response regulator, partial [Anaerolineales bacterium]|nr:response regulator [Anaerolineales bacterium]